MNYNVIHKRDTDDDHDIISVIIHNYYMVELTGYHNDNDDIYKRNMKTITNVIAMG